MMDLISGTLLVIGCAWFPKGLAGLLTLLSAKLLSFLDVLGMLPPKMYLSEDKKQTRDIYLSISKLNLLNMQNDQI